MDYSVQIGDEWILPEERFDNAALIDVRARNHDPTKRAAFSRAMRFLYMSNGAKNLSRDQMLACLPTLEAREKRAIRWIYTRTNGSERKNYGPDSIVAMRKAKFRCQRCGFPDVRTLQVDHVTGRKAKPFVFQCLCANCHSIETYDRSQVVPAPAAKNPP
jgi:hypothetical protein